MKKIEDGTDNLVILGAWNIAIFTQEWVKENILPKDSECTIYYPQMVGFSLLFELPLFSFCIQGDRLTFKLRNYTEEACVAVVQTVRVLLQKLIHTPVRALGVNIVFSNTTRFKVWNNLTDTESLQKVISLVGNKVDSQAIVRSFSISNNEQLNLKIETVDNSDKADFNFNYNIKSIADIFQIIGDDDRLIWNKIELANKIYDDVYCE